ncbi:MAG TPA: hypothetical protein VF453_06645 [Burkholderiaceae bacterium]
MTPRAPVEGVLLTHKGWFGVCPVYLGDLDTEAPLIDPRSPLLIPLFLLSEAMFGLCFTVLAAAGRENPGWALKITGKLRRPIRIEAPRICED